MVVSIRRLMMSKYAVMVAGIVTPGMEDYVREYLTKMMEYSRQDEGCLVYNIHQAIENPSEFMMYSEWESRAAFEKHNNTPIITEFKEELAKAMFGVQSPLTEWSLLE